MYWYLVRSCKDLTWANLYPLLTRTWMNSSVMSFLSAMFMSTLVYFILLIRSCRKELKTVSSIKAVPLWIEMLSLVGFVKCLCFKNHYFPHSFVWKHIIFKIPLSFNSDMKKKSIMLLRLLQTSSLILSWFKQYSFITSCSMQQTILLWSFLSIKHLWAKTIFFAAMDKKRQRAKKVSLDQVCSLWAPPHTGPRLQIIGASQLPQR